MDSLFSYLDYQRFLRDYYEEKKSQTAFFSYRYFGNKLGLDAGFLVKVLQGKMHLAIKSLPRIYQYFGFDEKERLYFETLVRYGRAESGNEIKTYFEKLLALADIDARTIEVNQYEFYQKWYYAAIREALGFHEFRGDFAGLARLFEPRLTVKEAKAAIELLLRLNLIHQDPQGVYRQTASFITTSEKWRSAAIHSFQKETLRIASDSLDTIPKEIRDISTLTLSVSHEDFAEIRERIADFRQSLLNMKNDRKADCVYQVNIQAVPLTRIEEGAQ